MTLDRFDRQGFLGAGSRDLYESLRVGIVGLGGGGSHIAQQLAHLGVGNYVLADPDTIEESNLNRLVGGTTADVEHRMPKTEIASRQISSVMPDAAIVQITSEWQAAAELLRDCDLIVGCVDSFAQRQQLEQAARRYLIPYIDIGMDVFATAFGFAIAGQIALSLPGGACLHCMGILRDENLALEAQAYGAAGPKPQVVWPNGLLASAAVGLAVQLFTPWNSRDEIAILVEYDGNHNALLASPVLEHLPSQCEHYSDINLIGDPWFSLDSIGSAVRIP